MIYAHGTEFAQPHQRSAEKVQQAVQGLFFQMLMKEMQKGQSSSLLGDGPAASLTKDMLSQVVAKHLGEQVDLGLTDRLTEQMGQAVQMNRGRPLSGSGRGLVAPVDGRISSRYGFRSDPLTGQRRFHEGLDIAAPAGSPIRSISPGLVVHAGVLGDYGLSVKVRQNDGTLVIYGHCENVEVKAGYRVEPGQVLGQVGATGRATGPHLHLEVRAGGRSRNPEQVLANRAASGPQVGLKRDD
jgi:murein DD-endopeptidase MepM/ murein hydrolase activator NlpD